MLFEKVWQNRLHKAYSSPFPILIKQKRSSNNKFKASFFVRYTIFHDTIITYLFIFSTQKKLCLLYKIYLKFQEVCLKSTLKRCKTTFFLIINTLKLVIFNFFQKFWKNFQKTLAKFYILWYYISALEKKCVCAGSSAG